VLHEGAHHGCRAFGTQGQLTAALVRELVHLLADDVGVGPETGEDLEVLEDRRDQALVAEPFRPGRELLFEHRPAGGVGRQHVLGVLRRAELRSIDRHRRIVPTRSQSWSV
jgi:hypothetical protein